MKTAEELYQEMTEVFARQTGMEAVAGEAAVRMYALAAQVYGLYAELDWTRKQCFPQTATGEALDKHGFLRGLTRQAATKAEGKLRFSVQVAAGEELPIPKGTVGLTAGQVAFETVEEAVLSAGSLSVDVLAQAVEAGPSHDGDDAAALHVQQAQPHELSPLPGEQHRQPAGDVHGRQLRVARRRDIACERAGGVIELDVAARSDDGGDAVSLSLRSLVRNGGGLGAEIVELAAQREIADGEGTREQPRQKRRREQHSEQTAALQGCASST